MDTVFVMLREKLGRENYFFNSHTKRTTKAVAYTAQTHKKSLALSDFARTRVHHAESLQKIAFTSSSHRNEIGELEIVNFDKFWNRA